MNIRKANKDDIKEIINLLKQIARLHFKQRPDIFKKNAQKYTENELCLLLENENKPIFVAIDENTSAVIGYAFCVIHNIKNSTILQDKKTLYIDDLCVDEHIRSKGIGKQLFDYVKKYAKSIGCDNIDLNAWEENKSAIKFYEKCGMTIQKRHMELNI